ncbi:alpha/beta hydrolase [Tsuneonella deserti]|uniref:Alpha/beta hydrolase n=1 Tax=Tsuneonella deserti TaxID=2035528 RepID=A0ABQ1S9N6_9SPHN|nr:alpha/beta hydrolase [Tsuneonella deserti]GGD97562.1 alpha/beta hydrolase [Tsuneonella deserti]
MRKTAKVLGLLAVLLVGTFLLLRTPDSDPAAMRAKYGAAPSQFIDIGGGERIHLRDEGPRDGLPIVLLHGSNADLHTWQPWVDRLKATHRIIRFDQRGHGLTGPAPDGDYSRRAFADDVERVANTLNLRRFVLAGNSMGGGIALEYALAHPGRVAGLVLVDAAGAPRLREVKGNIGFTLARTPGFSWLMGQITPRSLIERSLRQTVSNQSVVTDAAVDRYWELLRYPGNRQATAARFATAQEAFSPAALDRLKVPTLIIWGQEDGLIPVASGRWLAQHIPSSRFEVLPGIGHIPMEEAPDASARLLIDWLARLEPAAD